ISSRLPVDCKSVELLTFAPPIRDSLESIFVIADRFWTPHCTRYQVFNPLDVPIICCLCLGYAPPRRYSRSLLMKWSKGITRRPQELDTFKLKRRRDNADKDEEPSAGSDQGSKRRREGKEPESTSTPKEKETKTTVKVAVQIQSDRLRDEAQAENKEFLKNLDENIQKIIKEQVKEQVKVQVSKILQKIEKTVNEQLKVEVLT
nr:hypothetical protein [Tanacetum cinerariifolium]